MPEHHSMHTWCNEPGAEVDASSNSTLQGSITDSEPQALALTAHVFSYTPSGIGSATLTNNSEYRIAHSSEASYSPSSAPSMMSDGSAQQHNYPDGHSDKSLQTYSDTESAYSRNSHRSPFYTAYGPNGEVSRRSWPTSHTSREASPDGIRNQQNGGDRRR